jgi:hexosaminidase
MTKYATLIICTILTLACLCTAIKVWPQPSKFEIASSTKIGVVQSWKTFAITHDPITDPEASSILDGAISRYKSLLFYDQTISIVPPSSCETYACLTGLKITFRAGATLNAKLDLNMDERYTLSINSEVVSLEVYSIWGALRGIETFSQLVRAENISPDLKAYVITYNLPITIDDTPRFPWRGFMLDTSRHYMSLQKMLSIIDSMSYMKFNVFHWHIIDDEAFPLVVDGWPLLSDKGAWSNDQKYTKDDIKHIVAYAKQRGIRVVMEIVSFMFVIVYNVRMYLDTQRSGARDTLI